MDAVTAVVQLAASLVCLLALVGALNILTWWGIQRSTPGRPWHWTVVLGAFAYYPWLNRHERMHR